MNITALFRRTQVLQETNNAAVLRPSAEPAVTSVCDEAEPVSIVDGAGRMLVDQHGRLIISGRAGNK
jgi:hypothetical protein